MFVELDECQELSDSMRSAILSAQSALHSKSLEISILKDQTLLMEQKDENKQVIIDNLSWDLRAQKRRTVFKVILGGIAGFLIGKAF